MHITLKFKTFPGTKTSISEVTMAFPDPCRTHSLSVLFYLVPGIVKALKSEALLMKFHLAFKDNDFLNCNMIWL